VSCNDPHLEALIEFESRSAHHRESPPPGFARKQAWLLGIIVVAVMAAFWFASGPLFWMALAGLPAIGVALIMNRRDPKPPENSGGGSVGRDASAR
jgi:hypothetical protein